MRGKNAKPLDYVALASAVMALILFSAIIHSEPSPAKIVWVDADALAFTDASGPHYGKVRVTAPGEAGVPVPFTEPTNALCSSGQNGSLDATGKWRCRCSIENGRFNGCWQNWIGPPPLVPCTHTTAPRVQFGWSCAEGIDGIAGWQGAWRGATRP